MAKLNFKKLLKYLLFSSIGIFVCFVIYGNILSHYFSYDSVDVFSIPKPAKMHLFNDSAIKQIINDDLQSERSNDSIYFSKYKKDYELVLWKITQYQNSSLAGIIDTTPWQYAVKQKAWYTYIDSKDDKDLNIESKQSLYPGQKLTVHFYNCKDVHYIRSSNTYEYYHLKAGTIYLISDKNSFFDVGIGLANYTDIDFLITLFDSNIYVVLLHPIKEGCNIDPEELFKMLRVELARAS